MIFSIISRRTGAETTSLFGAVRLVQSCLNIEYSLFLLFAVYQELGGLTLFYIKYNNRETRPGQDFEENTSQNSCSRIFYAWNGTDDLNLLKNHWSGFPVLVTGAV
jgi:hypothetical protein